MKSLPFTIIAVMLATPASAQWLNYSTPGIPRTATGAANLAAHAPRTPDGRPDFSGVWRSASRSIAAALKPKERWVTESVRERRENLGKDAMTVHPESLRAQTAQTAPLIVGTWRINAGKSNLRLSPDYVEIRQYSLRPDGFLVGLLITGTPRAYHYLQFVAKSDGKDYPEYSDQIVGDLVAAGKPTRSTYAERAIDDYVTEWIDKVDGRVTAQGRKIISKDGKTLTITTDGAPATRIYDRQ